jgi:hypothetical protein
MARMSVAVFCSSSAPDGCASSGARLGVMLTLTGVNVLTPCMAAAPSRTIVRG